MFDLTEITIPNVKRRIMPITYDGPGVSPFMGPITKLRAPAITKLMGSMNLENAIDAFKNQ